MVLPDGDVVVPNVGQVHVAILVAALRPTAVQSLLVAEDVTVVEHELGFDLPVIVQPLPAYQETGAVGGDGGLLLVVAATGDGEG